MSFNTMGNKRLQNGGKEGEEMHMAEKGNEGNMTNINET